MVTQPIKQLTPSSGTFSHIPEKPGVNAAIFLDNSSLFTFVLRGARWTLNIEALEKKKTNKQMKYPYEQGPAGRDSFTEIPHSLRFSQSRPGGLPPPLA